MIFLGTAFCSDGNSLFPPTSSNKALVSLQIYDGTYNQIYLSTDPSFTVDNLGDAWSEHTKINATFDETLDPNSLGFSLQNTDHLVIRRREMGKMDWTIIHVKKVETIEDFNIHIIDTYARSGIEYEYSVSSYVNGIENSYVVNNVYSEFDGYYITDKDCLYGTVYNVDGCDTTQNTSRQVIELLNSKYMNVVSNSSINCSSGTVTGAFFKIYDDGLPNTEEGLQYRMAVTERLINKKPLILKIGDGRIWMIKASGTVSDTMDGHRAVRNLSFDWVEIGDVNDMKTLYMNGFSDIDSRWW